MIQPQASLGFSIFTSTYKLARLRNTQRYKILRQGIKMSLKKLAADEFKRGPITVTATVTGVLIALVALLVAWLQYAGPPAIAAQRIEAWPASSFHLTNLLLVTSAFLANSLSLASLIHILDRSHPFHAAVLSIPAAVLAAFFSLLVIQLAPPRSATDQSLELAKDVVFWATLFVFLALNGRSAAAGLIDAKPSEKEKLQSDTEPAPVRTDQSGGEIFILLIVLLLWGTLVSAGINKLTKLFLQ